MTSYEVPQDCIAPLEDLRAEGHIFNNLDTPRRAHMSTFDDRENAFENKFAHDAEMQFKAEARRNKLLGLWAAGLMGKSDAEAEAYAKDVIKADFEEAGDDDVVRKVAADLGSKADEDAIRTKMSELLAEAKAQLISEL
jgi:hypothetical protein